MTGTMVKGRPVAIVPLLFVWRGFALSPACGGARPLVCAWLLQRAG